MSNPRVSRALDDRDGGDIMKYLSLTDDIVQKNSGVRDNKTLCIDSAEPPCPVQKGQYTKVKLTDESIMITNIDKSYISAEINLTIVRTHTEAVESIPTMITQDEYPEASLAYFVGFKSAIHLIDAYRIYSNNKKTSCEQTEAIYENAVTGFLKPREETRSRKHTYTPHSNAYNMSPTVCGTYISEKEFSSNAGEVTVNFEVNIPIDDFLPLSGMTIFPNCVFGNLQLELKMAIQNNLVWTQCSMQKALDLSYSGQAAPGGPALMNEMVDQANAYAVCRVADALCPSGFVQIGDSGPIRRMLQEFSGGPEKTTSSGKVCLSCTNGSIVSCRSNVNGFNIKDSVAESLYEKYLINSLIVPAQFVDYQAFSQRPTGTGLKCNTTYGLVNATNVIVTFPTTGNEVTVSKNPRMSSIQLQIDNKPFPDKPFSTYESAHYDYNLVNGGLDNLFSPSDDYSYSLSDNYTIGDSVSDAMKSGMNRNGCDNTSYCLNCATERLSGYGVFCDGITKDSAHISLSGTNSGSTTANPYLYPDGVTMNNNSPLMMIVQDCFWRCSTDKKKGVEFIINNRMSENLQDEY